MSLDLGDKTVPLDTNLANTTIMGIKDGFQLVSIPIASIGGGGGDGLVLDGGHAPDEVIRLTVDGGGANG